MKFYRDAELTLSSNIRLPDLAPWMAMVRISRETISAKLSLITKDLRFSVVLSCAQSSQELAQTNSAESGSLNIVCYSFAGDKAIFSVNAFEQAPLHQVLTDFTPQNSEGSICNQLEFRY